jgi:hypothetical protein
MNPFTHFLRRRLRQPSLDEFVERWDRLERLVISVYKDKAATAEDEAIYAEIRPWLQQHYPQWRTQLQTYWPQALIGGQPAREDPFLFLLQAEEAADYVDNWLAMQTLPAAREALNQLVTALAASDSP